MHPWHTSISAFLLAVMVAGQSLAHTTGLAWVPTVCSSKVRQFEEQLAILRAYPESEMATMEEVRVFHGADGQLISQTVTVYASVRELKERLRQAFWSVRMEECGIPSASVTLNNGRGR